MYMPKNLYQHFKCIFNKIIVSLTNALIFNKKACQSSCESITNSWKKVILNWGTCHLTLKFNISDPLAISINFKKKTFDRLVPVLWMFPLSLRWHTLTRMVTSWPTINKPPGCKLYMQVKTRVSNFYIHAHVNVMRNVSKYSLTKLFFG